MRGSHSATTCSPAPTALSRRALRICSGAANSNRRMRIWRSVSSMPASSPWSNGSARTRSRRSTGGISASCDRGTWSRCASCPDRATFGTLQGVPTLTRAARDPFALGPHSRELLARRLGDALARARRQRVPVLAALTVSLPGELDLSAAVLAARRPDDRFFCFEQPDRDGFALAGLGQAAVVEARGPERFGEVAARARELGRHALVDDPGRDPRRPPAAGPVFVGGFAFAPDGGASPEWSSLNPASLVLPEVSFARHRGEARMTLTVALDGDEAPDAVLERMLDRVAELEPATMPLLDPDPVERTRVASTAPPVHFEQAVERAVERIRSG